MTSDWPELSIDDLKAASKNAIAMGPFGSRIKAENFVKSGVPIIKGGNLNGDFLLEDKFDFLTEEKASELKASNAFRRDIVITHRGTIGQVGIIPDNSKYARYVASQSQLKVTLDQEKINPYFVYYFLRSPVGQHRLLANASQVGVPAIAQASTSVKSILVPCPDRDIQDRIVEVSLYLDHKTELNRKTNQTLEEMAQAVFKSWFVDFEPTRAKIKAVENGQDPTRAAMATIVGKTVDQLDTLSAEQIKSLTTTADLFPDAFEPSALGEIPVGWTLQTLEDVIELPYGKALKKTDRVAGKFPVYGSGGITGTHQKSLVDGPGVIVGRKGTVGSLYWEDHSFYPIDTVFYVRCKGHATLEYAFYLLQTLGLEGMNTDAAVPGLNRNNAYRLQVPKAPSALIGFFSTFTRALRDQMKNGREEIKTLVQLRDTLLPKLLSGELDLSEAP